MVQSSTKKQKRQLDAVVVRFAGDSGDGMQLTGMQFTDTTALVGNDISTFPSFPAEIRAPAGTLPGVSGFQINFANQDIRTPGDEPDVLVAMNPAALKVNLPDLPEGGILIANSDTFIERNLDKAGYKTNPLTDGSLSKYKVFSIPISTLNMEALKDIPDLSRAQADRCKNFFALGVMFWMYDRPLDHTLKWIQQKFAKVPAVALANERVLKAGHAYAETTEILSVQYEVKPAPIAPGVDRKITGN